jgi:AraC family transcriptional regulator
VRRRAYNRRVTLPPATCLEDFHVSHHRVGPFDVIHNRYPASYLLERHEHEVPTIYLVLRGSHVEQAAGSSAECAAGSIVFSPQGASHADAYGTAGGEAFLIELPPRVIETAREAGARVDAPRHLPLGPATPLMHRLYDEAAHQDDVGPFAFEALLLHILATLHRSASGGRRAIPRWLVRARELMHDRFNQSLSLSEVAAAAEVHPVHLSTMFHRVYGVTFGAYLRQLRVGEARRALMATDKAIAEIALDCGFSDQSHLSRAFRQATGMSPARYRRIVRS